MAQVGLAKLAEVSAYAGVKARTAASRLLSPLDPRPARSRLRRISRRDRGEHGQARDTHGGPSRRPGGEVNVGSSVAPVDEVLVHHSGPSAELTGIVWETLIQSALHQKIATAFSHHRISKAGGHTEQGP